MTGLTGHPSAERGENRRRRRAIGSAVAWLVAVIVLAGCADAKAEEPAVPERAETAARVTNVTTAPAAERTFRERLNVQGNLDARQSAMVGPKLPGTIAAILVDEGDAVVAGETPLFRTDDARLKKAVEVSRAALALTKTSIREARARQEQAAVALRRARQDLERYQELHTRKTVADELLEQVEAGHAQARAAHKHAGVLIQLAKDQSRQAEVTLSIAEQDLADATVVAPVSGVVTRRMAEPGEMGAPGRPVVRIDDPSVVEVSGFLPAQVYSRIRAGETMMRVTVYDVDKGTVPISYKSPTIVPTTRTFEVRCLLDNADGAVAPGAMAEIDVTLAERRRVGVPERAVVERGGKTYVFLVDEGRRARMVPVALGLESDGWVEVTGDGVVAGTPVVTVGQSMLDDGATVKLTAAHDGATAPR